MEFTVRAMQRSQVVVTHALTIETDASDTDCLVRLRGELDSASAPELREQLHNLLGLQIERVVVDLDDLEFIDSSGLHALLAATRRARGGGTELRIIEPRGPVARVFRLTNLHRVLPLVANGEDRAALK